MGSMIGSAARAGVNERALDIKLLKCRHTLDEQSVEEVGSEKLLPQLRDKVRREVRHSVEAGFVGALPVHLL